MINRRKGIEIVMSRIRKALRWLKNFVYGFQRGTRLMPKWVTDCEPEPIVDEVIKEGWDLNV